MGERLPNGPARCRGLRVLHAGLAASAALSSAPAPAHAQVPPGQPVAPTREEVDRPRPSPTEAPPARLTVDGDVERAPCALDRPDYANIRFTLREVVFDDLRGLTAEQLRPAWAPYVGRETGVATICEIRDRAATILREAGYIAAVEVPEQRIADGNVRFTVLMAKLVGIRVRGEAGRSERVIAGYLNKLTEREVFNRYEAERYLLLAGDLPGYDVRLALRAAGAARGEVIGEVTVARRPALVDVTVQNLGSRELGRWGGLLRAQLYGLTGLGDRTTIAVFSTADTKEQQTLQVGHDFRIGGEGLAIGGQLTYAWASPDLNLAGVEIDSRTLFATIEASYPFIRRQTRTLRGAIGLDVIEQDIDFNGLPLHRDRLRVAFARVGYDALGLSPGNPRYTPAEPLWRLGFSAEARRGLDIFGASPGCGPGLAFCLVPNAVPPTRLEGDPTATILRGNIYGEYRPMPRLTFAFDLRGQYSADPLFSFEEFSAGNYTAGRGYDPGALLGDSGIGLQAEIRFGSAAPRRADQFAAEPYVFFDHAWVWNRDLLFATGRQRLSSIGAGVRAAYGDRFRIDLLVAEPLDRLPFQTSRGDTRFLVSLTTRLWPWRSR
jgi:hemolysin activation/secretion protein